MGLVSLSLYTASQIAKTSVCTFVTFFLRCRHCGSRPHRLRSYPSSAHTPPSDLLTISSLLASIRYHMMQATLHLPPEAGPASREVWGRAPSQPDEGTRLNGAW